MTADDDDTRTLIVANAIGWELCHDDGRSVTHGPDGAEQITVSQDELDLHLRVACRVIRDLDEYDRPGQEAAS